MLPYSNDIPNFLSLFGHPLLEVNCQIIFIRLFSFEAFENILQNLLFKTFYLYNTHKNSFGKKFVSKVHGCVEGSQTSVN